MMNLQFTTQVFKEGNLYVSYTPGLDISSCGHTVDEARKNLQDAVKGFLESAEKRGVLDEILEEGGYIKEDDGKNWNAPELLILEKAQLAYPNA